MAHITYLDARGVIIDVSDMHFEGLQIIHSKKDSVRGNHYHKLGGHLIYVISGKMEYIEAEFDSMVLTKQIVGAGESVFTGPLVTNKCTFLEDTVMVLCSTLKRTDGGYLADLVRRIL